jgi:hypothetical protein
MKHTCQSNRSSSARYTKDYKKYIYSTRLTVRYHRYDVGCKAKSTVLRLEGLERHQGYAGRGFESRCTVCKISKT